MAAPLISRDLNLDALDHYLSFLYTPRDQSIFAAVRKLPPGRLLLWRDGRAYVRQYWQLGASESQIMDSLDLALLTGGGSAIPRVQFAANVLRYRQGAGDKKDRFEFIDRQRSA